MSLADLNQHKVMVREWNVAQSASLVQITATVNYIVNEKNSFTVAYVYDISSDGSLITKYEVNPKIEAKFLPHIEVDFSLNPRLSRMRWLVLGPIDTYPNESAAGIFGVWSADKGEADANGLKTTCWLEMGDSSHTVGALRIENSPYVRCDTDTLQVVAAEEGRVMKNRLPEKPEQKLDVTPGRKFHGAFTMRSLPSKHS